MESMKQSDIVERTQLYSDKWTTLTLMTKIAPHMFFKFLKVLSTSFFKTDMLIMARAADADKASRQSLRQIRIASMMFPNQMHASSFSA